MSMPVKVTLWPRNNTVLELGGLHDVITDDYINGATTTCTVKDSNGDVVSGGNEIAMAYITGSDGGYRGEILYSTFNPPIGTQYTAEITAIAGGIKMELTLPCEVELRRQ